jgi:hypothetical protein
MKVINLAQTRGGRNPVRQGLAFNSVSATAAARVGRQLVIAIEFSVPGVSAMSKLTNYVTVAAIAVVASVISTNVTAARRMRGRLYKVHIDSDRKCGRAAESRIFALVLVPEAPTVRRLPPSLKLL